MLSSFMHRFAPAFVAGVALSPTFVYATGSGTRIDNSVTVQFSVGGVGQDDSTANAAFVVDRKIDMLVADTGPITNARPKQTARELVYKITNEGNDAQAFDIDVLLTESLSGTAMTLDTNTDTLGASEYRVYISADDTLDGGDTVYDPASFVLASTPAAFDPAGDTDEFHVIIRLNIPSDSQDEDTIRFSVRATALNASNDGPLLEVLGNGLDDAVTPADAVDIVFADGEATADSDGTDAIEDGKHTDNALVTIASASVVATKSVTIVDENTQSTFDCTATADPAIPDGTQGAMPGACLEYTITIANGAAASANADSISISDPLPTGVSFSAFFGDNSEWTSPAHNAGTVTATLTNSLAPGESADLSFRVTVD